MRGDRQPASSRRKQKGGPKGVHLSVLLLLAIEAFGKALAVKPRWPGALLDKANSLRVVGRPEEALTYYREELPNDPTGWMASVELARTILTGTFPKQYRSGTAIQFFNTPLTFDGKSRGGARMEYLLPLSLLAVFVVLLAAMPWRRPDPNHEFIVDICRRLPH